ncbi:prepilin peptidase [Oxalobacteraceae bacterium OTU3CINTB1]|nr:prepilin peptidase [Oxalobacteraceae bacterium OTU3CINTB1]
MNKLPLILLSLLLALAVWNDLRARRIPNTLVFGGAVLGIALNCLYPDGAGLFAAPQGGIGFAWSLAGLATGLALLLPMYAMRALGAGDVKLMAMVGAFAGPWPSVVIVLLTLLAGGVLALAVAAWNGRLRAMMRNTYQMGVYAFMRRLGGEQLKIEAPAEASGRLPYAIAIAAGTLPYLAWGAVNGQALFS